MLQQSVVVESVDWVLQLFLCPIPSLEVVDRVQGRFRYLQYWCEAHGVIAGFKKNKNYLLLAILRGRSKLIV